MQRFNVRSEGNDRCFGLEFLDDNMQDAETVAANSSPMSISVLLAGA